MLVYLALCVGAVGGVLSAPLPSPPPTMMWSQWGHDSRHTSQSAFAGPHGNGVTLGVGARFTVRVNGAALAPGVVDGVGNVYLAHGGAVSAIEGMSGSVMWNTSIGAAVSSLAPAVDAGAVYVVDSAACVHGLDAGGGAVRWTSCFPAGDSIVGGVVVDAQGELYVVCQSGRVAKLAPAVGGKLRWSTVVNGTLSSAAAVASDTGVVYVGSSAGQVHALDAGSGAVQWTCAVPVADDGGVSTPVIGADRLYVGGQGTVSAVTLAGLAAGTFQCPVSGAVPAPAIDTVSGMVYVSCPGTSPTRVTATTGYVECYGVGLHADLSVWVWAWLLTAAGRFSGLWCLTVVCRWHPVRCAGGPATTRGVASVHVPAGINADTGCRRRRVRRVVVGGGGRPQCTGIQRHHGCPAVESHRAGCAVIVVVAVQRRHSVRRYDQWPAVRTA